MDEMEAFEAEWHKASHQWDGNYESDKSVALHFWQAHAQLAALQSAEKVDDVQEAFERVAGPAHYNLRPSVSGKGYANKDTEHAWWLWQQARALLAKQAPNELAETAGHERNFCSRCGKRINAQDASAVHTCVPPATVPANTDDGEGK